MSKLRGGNPSNPENIPGEELARQKLKETARPSITRLARLWTWLTKEQRIEQLLDDMTAPPPITGPMDDLHLAAFRKAVE